MNLNFYHKPSCELTTGMVIHKGDILFHKSWSKTDAQKESALIFQGASGQDNRFWNFKQGVYNVVHSKGQFFDSGWMIYRYEKESTGFGKFIQRIEAKSKSSNVQDFLEPKKRKLADRKWVEKKEHPHG